MIRFEDVIVQIGDFQLTVNMTVPKGFTTVIGQSGAGKSTLLSLLSGHRELTSGKIFVDGTRVDLLPPFQRPCSTIFQEFNLFPHLTISQNLNLVCGKSFFVSDISREKIKRVLEKVGIVELIDRLPSEISGGQQSRAALARVLLQDNPILLLDEPFSALGPNQKSELIELVYSLSKEQGITVLLITHDPKDAKQVGGQCIVVKDKKALGPFETSEALKKNGLLKGYL
ncbi:MAG: ATP-binding cassette domain-containing protein [Paracoccaceae bacterium]